MCEVMLGGVRPHAATGGVAAGVGTLRRDLGEQAGGQTGAVCYSAPWFSGPV
jgi:hypothetical protein